MTALRRVALAAYFGLAVLILVWEAWMAPATPVPRGFWIAVKLLPLAVPLPWLVRANARAYLAAALVLLLYFCDGIATAYHAARTAAPAALLYGTAESVAALIFIVTASFYVRFSFRAARLRADAETES